MLTKRFVIELIKLEHLCKVYLYVYFNIIFHTHNIEYNWVVFTQYNLSIQTFLLMLTVFFVRNDILVHKLLLNIDKYQYYPSSVISKIKIGKCKSTVAKVSNHPHPHLRSIFLSNGSMVLIIIMTDFCFPLSF